MPTRSDDGHWPTACCMTAVIRTKDADGLPLPVVRHTIEMMLRIIPHSSLRIAQPSFARSSIRCGTKRA